MAKGDPAELKLSDVAALESAEAGDVSLFSDRKYANAFAVTKASRGDHHPTSWRACPMAWLLLVVPNPRLAFAQVGHIFYPPAKLQAGVRPASRCIPPPSSATAPKSAPARRSAPHAKIGAHVFIGNNVVIGRGVEIGDHCAIGPNCVITHALIGKPRGDGPQQFHRQPGLSVSCPAWKACCACRNWAG